jgi:uncharacterized membrane protein
MKEQTIKKKTKQLLAALGAIAVLAVIMTLGASGSLSEDVKTYAWGIIVFGLYFLPIIFAIGRKHPQIAPISIINILLGWTIIGWIAALIWSVAAFKREEVAPPVPQNYPPASSAAIPPQPQYQQPPLYQQPPQYQPPQYQQPPSGSSV